MTTGKGKLDVAVTYDSVVRRKDAPFFESYQGETEHDWEIHIGKLWIVISRIPHKARGHHRESAGRNANHHEDHRQVHRDG